MNVTVCGSTRWQYPITFPGTFHVELRSSCCLFGYVNHRPTEACGAKQTERKALAKERATSVESPSFLWYITRPVGPPFLRGSTRSPVSV